MNDHNTIEKMKQMRLKGMAEYHYRAKRDNLHRDCTTDQYLALLVDTESEIRQNRKMASLIKAAGFKIDASINDIDYTGPRNLDRNYFERLAGLNFMENRENIIITGATGTGKSHLAQAFGPPSLYEHAQDHVLQYLQTDREDKNKQARRLVHQVPQQDRKNGTVDLQRLRALRVRQYCQARPYGHRGDEI